VVPIAAGASAAEVSAAARSAVYFAMGLADNGGGDAGAFFSLLAVSLADKAQVKFLLELSSYNIAALDAPPAGASAQTHALLAVMTHEGFQRLTNLPLEKLAFAAPPPPGCEGPRDRYGRAARARTPVALADCLAAELGSREQLSAANAWRCPRCAADVRAFKELELWRAPRCLTIQLKRFAKEMGGWGAVVAKDATLVDFPARGLDMTPWVKGPPSAQPAGAGARHVYDLFAVSEHSGGTTGGHYTAVVRDAVSRRWVRANDGSVSPCARDEPVVSDDAYVLFYVRREESAGGSDGGAAGGGAGGAGGDGGVGAGGDDDDGGSVGALAAAVGSKASGAGTHSFFS